MVGLIDCNNFFVSCERIFRPDLTDRPVVVMSNNDGCAVAMSNEAKALGITRGIPVFQVKKLIERYNVTTLSGNHRLYGDISSRVMSTIASIVPEIEIYSVDECFIDFSPWNDNELESIGRQIVTRVRRDVGIPTSLGIAPTKTLAKIASHFAKKYKGYRAVCVIDNEQKRRKALEMTPISDVWGIGRRLAVKLKEYGIETAAQFADTPLPKIRKILNINGQRTWSELNGTPCIDLEFVEPDRKQICCTRSFSQAFTDIEPLREALSYFADNISRKLRKQHGCAKTVTIFIHTNSFRPDLPQHCGNATIELDEATDDTLTLTDSALRLLAKTFRKGYAYKRAGVMVTDIVSRNAVQQSLFATAGEREKRRRLMDVIDRINNSDTATDKLHLATTTPNRQRVKQEELSPLYSTRLSDIITVKTS